MAHQDGGAPSAAPLWCVAQPGSGSGKTIRFAQLTIEEEETTPYGFLAELLAEWLRTSGGGVLTAVRELEVS